MKVGALLFYITAVVIFLQIALGGLLTFTFISAAPHVIFGFVIFIVAIATMIVSLVSKPSFKPVKIVSIIMAVLILVQGALGFSTLNSGSQLVAWIHLVNAMVIFGVAISGTSLAIRWNAMSSTISVSKSSSSVSMGQQKK
jgi:heme A synthase